MDLKNRTKRLAREKLDEPLTTITNQKKVSTKQSAPTCYRFNEYDKAEISLAVANAQLTTVAKVTPAKLLRALVRINNSGEIDQAKLSQMLDSL